MSALEFRRVLLEELAQAEAEGWRPAVELPCGAVGADPVSGGTIAAVAVVREVVVTIPRHADGSACWLTRGACVCYQLGRRGPVTT